MERNEKEQEELVREDCQMQLNQQRRLFLGARAVREQEFMEKALEFEGKVRSGGATSSKPPARKMTPSASEADSAFHPATPPRKRTDRLEFLSPTDDWSECDKSEVPVMKAATTTTTTKTKTGTTTRASGRPMKGARSDPDDPDPPDPPCGTPVLFGWSGIRLLHR